MGLLRSIVYGLWRGLDVLRRFLHLLLLLIVFGFVIGALRGSVPTIPVKAALLVAPEGDIVEQSSGDPLERAVQEARGQLLVLRQRREQHLDRHPLADGLLDRLVDRGHAPFADLADHAIAADELVLERTFVQLALPDKLVAHVLTPNLFFPW